MTSQEQLIQETDAAWVKLNASYKALMDAVREHGVPPEGATGKSVACVYDGGDYGVVVCFTDATFYGAWFAEFTADVQYTTGDWSNAASDSVGPQYVLNSFPESVRGHLPWINPLRRILLENLGCYTEKMRRLQLLYRGGLQSWIELTRAMGWDQRYLDIKGYVK